MLRTETLTQNKDFLTLYRHGKTVVSPYVVLYVKKNRLGRNRLGITAGKKVGNAVCRNRAKRVIRAAYREAEEKLPVGIDMVIVARAAICDIRSTELTKFLTGQGLRRLNRCLSEMGGNRK
ncbi:MAG: ribonuclease P protein component [Ruminococcus sp.]|nr:ribonuclease P protein component [Ruminococcus sp.]